jgi:hypothetical protein
MSNIETSYFHLINHLPLTTVDSNLAIDFGFCHACKEAILLFYGTSAFLLKCPFMPEIMHGGALEFFLHQKS